MEGNDQQFNNQAFVPYAINGDETTYVPNGKLDTLTDCKNDGYVKPFLGAEISKNHEYEIPADVAKRADLNRAGSGPRRKKNQLYGESKKQKVRLPETPSTPVGLNDGAERSPLVVTTKDQGKTRKCNAKFFIFLILVFLLSATALAFSLLNMLQRNQCACNSALVDSDGSERKTNDPDLIKRLNKLQEQYEKLQNQLVSKKNLNILMYHQANSTLGKYFEEKLNATNKRFNKEISQLNQKLAARGSFKSCTVKNRANWFSKENDRTWVFVDEEKEYKIVGVTCVGWFAGKIQDSWLKSRKFKNGKLRYECGCKNSHDFNFKTINGTNGQCIMYYWQCPNT